ncbi:hypothetical protein C0989_009495 [Termitomyces sp. Mn162]|nr:hypothetical protein C0989_009495 [Termitomyces sp. Mn162]
MSDVREPTTQLGWGHIALGFTFILFDVGVSAYFRLGIERGLLTAAIRCVIQLAIMAVLLHGVFSAENPWAVAGIALLLNLLGTLEIVPSDVDWDGWFDDTYLNPWFALCNVKSALLVTYSLQWVFKP